MVAVSLALFIFDVIMRPSVTKAGNGVHGSWVSVR